MKYLLMILMAFVFVGCASVDTPNYMEMHPKRISIKNNGYSNSKYKFLWAYYTNGKENYTESGEITTSTNLDGSIYRDFKIDIKNTNKWKLNLLISSSKCGLDARLVKAYIVNNNGNVLPNSKKILESKELKKATNEFLYSIRHSNTYVCKKLNIEDTVGSSYIKKMIIDKLLPLINSRSRQKITVSTNIIGAVYFGIVNYDNKKLALMSFNGNSIKLKSNNVTIGNIKISGFALFNPITGITERSNINIDTWMLINEKYEKTNFKIKAVLDEM